MRGYYTGIHWSYLAVENDVNNFKSRRKPIWFCLHFHKPNIKQIYQDGRQACTDPTMQLLMLLPPQGLVISIFGFVSSSISTQTNRLGRIVDQHALALASRWSSMGSCKGYRFTPDKLYCFSNWNVVERLIIKYYQINIFRPLVNFD